MTARLLLGAPVCLLAVAFAAPPSAAGTATARAHASAGSCRVPRVLGDGPHHAAEELRAAGCAVGPIRRPRGNRSNRLIVVAQSVAPGAVVALHSRVRLTLGPRPPAPKGCRAPRFSSVLVATDEIHAWLNPLEELDNENLDGEGSQTYVACTPPLGRKWEFFTSEFSLSAYASLETLHSAGHFLAYTSSSADHYNSGQNALTLLNVARLRTPFDATFEFAEDDSGSTTFGEFALDADGTLAWVRIDRAGSSPPVYTLELHDASGDSTLESGASISHPAIAAGVLSWVGAGGVSHSQPLPAGS
jgi:hypothetical protein